MPHRKTKPKLPELDYYCRRILVYLIVIGKKIRFNDLHKFLAEKEFALAKPTLSKHLKHLTQEKLVLRKVEDVQKVTYEINHKIFRDLEKSVKSTAEYRKRLAEEEQIFDSISIDDQIDIVLEKMMLRNLRQLKTNIELELRPSKKWEKSLELAWLANPVFRYHEGLLIAKCKYDREYGEELLQKLGKLIKEIKNQNCGSI
jgi:DNA-binding HxlR family transcriptional regulator